MSPIIIRAIRAIRRSLPPVTVLRDAFLIVALLAVVVGCKPAAEPDAATPTPTPPATASGQPAAPPVTKPDDTHAQPDAQPNGSDVEPAMPALKVTTLDGKAYDIASHRGNWVVVNFWATWCAPCRKEMPELSALDAMRQNIDVIGLAYEDISPADMAAFLHKRPVVYPIAILDTGAPPADFDTPQGLPMTYLIAPDGTVAKRFVGPITAKEIEDAIAAAGGKAAA